MYIYIYIYIYVNILIRFIHLSISVYTHLWPHERGTGGQDDEFRKRIPQIHLACETRKKNKKIKRLFEWG